MPKRQQGRCAVPECGLLEYLHPYGSPSLGIATHDFLPPRAKDPARQAAGRTRTKYAKDAERWVAEQMGGERVPAFSTWQPS